MCGIAGVINYQDINLQKLLHSLKHRGPDDSAIYKENNVAILHARLAIQDVQLGKQPLHYAHYSITYNGEIYNHLELRKLLPEFTFLTNGDTETILYLFVKYKFKMFELLDGMFAFCIYDKNKNQIILARDRAGKKPLYYYQDTNSFIFASEINAIRTVKELTILPEAINCYLRAGFIWKPYTAYQNVFSLSAATYLVLDVNNLTYQSYEYFNLLNYYRNSSSLSLNWQESLLQTESKLKKSIADRITASDVDVGVFLSGGIDSNLIVALASQVKNNIKTFTVKFDGLYDESALALLTAQKYSTDHIQLNISNQLNQDIEKILLAYGEPFMDSSAIPCYYIAREARKHVKVVLSGDGADELFAGYRRYVPAYYNFSKHLNILNPLQKFLPKPKIKQSLYNYFYRLMAISNKQDLNLYLSATTDIFEDVISLPNDSITMQMGEHVKNIFSDNSLSELKKMLYADFSILLFCDLLVKMDIASMAHSLEVRSPFLSKYLLEFSPGLPDNYKINKFQTKYILRKLAEKFLPPELIKQPKRGFEIPLAKWVNQELRENIHDILKPGCYGENFIDKNFIRNILANKINVPVEKRAKILWALYTLEIWYKKNGNLCVE